LRDANAAITTLTNSLADEKTTNDSRKRKHEQDISDKDQQILERDTKIVKLTTELDNAQRALQSERITKELMVAVGSSSVMVDSGTFRITYPDGTEDVTNFK